MLLLLLQEPARKMADQPAQEDGRAVDNRSESNHMLSLHAKDYSQTGTIAHFERLGEEKTERKRDFRVLAPFSGAC